MRFTCEKNILMQGLNIAGRTVAQKSSLSAIEGILCRAGSGSGLTLTGYIQPLQKGLFDFKIFSTGAVNCEELFCGKPSSKKRPHKPCG